MMTAAGAGLYIHVPFCRRKCRYCDFYSRRAERGERDRYVAAVMREMELRSDRSDGSDKSDRSDRSDESERSTGSRRRAVGTVYFGGGTPSILGPERLAKILGALRERFDVAANAEITVEANPLGVTPAWAESCRSAGFNRMSIGVQSLDEDDLQFLGRLHKAADGPKAVETARKAGFAEIGIDLIYGLPGQTPDVLRSRITGAVEACRPEHVSCYQLTYAEKTPLGRDAAAGRVRRLSEDEEYDLFVLVHGTLTELGYPAYEVSNFSLGDAHRSRHNSNYWHGVPYLGLGPSAHSFEPPVRFDGSTELAEVKLTALRCTQGGMSLSNAARRACRGVRSWNVPSVSEYCDALEHGGRPVGGSETLSDEQLAAEMVMLALRTTDGLDLSQYQGALGTDFLKQNGAAVQQAVERGLVTVTGMRIRPTLDGLAVADRLSAEFT